MLTRLGGMRNITMPNFFQNWSIQSKDIAIFRFSKWKPTVSRGSRLMNMSVFRKIGQSVAKILTFFNFSKWRATPSWIFKFVKFHWQSVSGRPRLIFVLNVVKIGRLLWRYCNFSNFQNGRRRHLVFLK